MDNIPLLKSFNKLKSLQNLLTLSAVTLVITVWSTVSFLAYQNKLLKKYAKELERSAKLVETTPPVDSNGCTVEDNALSDWKTYKNIKYNFEIKYFLESEPSETIGTEDVGQFTYLMLVNFGKVPLKSQHGYILEVNKQKTLEDYRLELVGHITDKIDSEENIIINGYSWKKLNYQIFLTTDYIPVTLAFITQGKYGYVITAASLDIDQILSTFKFTEQFTPTPISTTSWKTYTDNTIGFSFKYPNNYQLQEETLERYLNRPGGAGDSLIQFFKKVTGHEPPKVITAISFHETPPRNVYEYIYQDHFEVWVYENSENLNPGQWYEQNQYFPLMVMAEKSDKYRPITPIKIGSYNGYSATINGYGNNTEIKYILVTRNTIMYVISLYTQSEISNKILSTFEFTN
jgi:hypothetical protein